MTDQVSVPTGRLQSVVRTWEYRGGWVRTPLREIAFNNRLTKQARLVWMWLASVPPESSYVSWGECETLLGCGTKARRNCIAQLVTEGFISVSESGVVTMHDPYEVFDKKRQEILQEMRESLVEDMNFTKEAESRVATINTIVAEKEMDKQIIEIKKEQKQQRAPRKEKAVAPRDNPVIDAWNQCKPESYSSLRTLSTKQQECINKHMKNLGLSKDKTEEFICSVCSGLKKSQFWSVQVAQAGRNFNSVFGYGNPQDTKMKNIENLYTLGHEDSPGETIKETVTFTKDQQDLLDSYRYVKMNYNSAKSRDEEGEAQRWKGYLDEVINQLNQADIDYSEF